MFVTIDDRLINLNHIDLIEPDAEKLTIDFYYATDSSTVTTVKYDDIKELIEALQKISDLVNTTYIGGRI